MEGLIENQLWQGPQVAKLNNIIDGQTDSMSYREHIHFKIIFPSSKTWGISESGITIGLAVSEILNNINTFWGIFTL